MQQGEKEEEREISSELLEPRWSVISFEKREAAGLTYADALQKLAELEKNKIAGICVVTDEAAERVAA
jgi:hypothetical protein